MLCSGTGTTFAPEASAISAVRSVLALSTTMTSTSRSWHAPRMFARLAEVLESPRQESLLIEGGDDDREHGPLSSPEPIPVEDLRALRRPTALPVGVRSSLRFGRACEDRSPPLMEEREVGPARPAPAPVRGADLPLDSPPHAEQGREHPPGLGRWPGAHVDTAKRPTTPAGTASPCSTRSARTRSPRACTREIASAAGPRTPGRRAGRGSRPANGHRLPARLRWGGAWGHHRVKQIVSRCSSSCAASIPSNAAEHGRRAAGGVVTSSWPWGVAVALTSWPRGRDQATPDSGARAPAPIFGERSPRPLR